MAHICYIMDTYRLIAKAERQLATRTVYNGFVKEAVHG